MHMLYPFHHYWYLIEVGCEKYLYPKQDGNWTTGLLFLYVIRGVTFHNRVTFPNCAFQREVKAWARLTLIPIVTMIVVIIVWELKQFRLLNFENHVYTHRLKFNVRLFWQCYYPARNFLKSSRRQHKLSINVVCYCVMICHHRRRNQTRLLDYVAYIFWTVHVSILLLCCDWIHI